MCERLDRAMEWRAGESWRECWRDRKIDEDVGCGQERG